MKKILLIEDDEGIRETTKEILELADYEVYIAENGKKGVELARVYKADLIICDIMMPDLDGYGVLNILSKNTETSSIPFVFLSAKSEKSDMRKGMNLGADDYITKPFEDNELLEAIDVRLQRSERLKQNFKGNVEGLNTFVDEARGIEDLKGLSEERRMRIYKKKEAIYHEGDYANYLYFITKGKVKCVKTDYCGKDFTNDIYGEGEYIGYMTLFEEGEYHETAIALESTEVSIIPKQDFLLLIRKNRDVAASFIKLISGNVQSKEKRLLQLAYAPVRERVADALLELKEKGHMQNGSIQQMEIPREDLASLIGTAKESLIRSLSELKKEGLVATDGQQITILDEIGLKKAATGL